MGRVKAFPWRVMRRIGCQDFLQFYEGPVRSGKTISSLLSWLLYLETQPVQYVMMSGDTLGSLYRNCLGSEFGLLNLVPGAVMSRKNNCNSLEIPTSHGIVTCYLFGADNIASADPLRGLTVEGWYADEITKHHREFVSEAFARTSASAHPVHIWTTNPAQPEHWVYKDYTDRYLHLSPEDKKRLGGYHEFHFTLDDNPALTDEMKASMKLRWTGWELERKYYGRRCRASGLVYPSLTDAIWTDTDKDGVKIRYCAIDFGTVHPTVMLWGGRVRTTQRWAIAREWYPTAQQREVMTVSQYADVFAQQCEDLGVTPYRVLTAIDPGGGGTALIREWQKRGWPCVKADKPVLPGISFTADLLANGFLTLDYRCVHLKSELAGYSWDDHAPEGKEQPLKQDDDCCDTMRYLAMTFIEPVYRPLKMRAPPTVFNPE